MAVILDVPAWSMFAQETRFGRKAHGEGDDRPADLFLSGLRRGGTFMGFFGSYVHDGTSRSDFDGEAGLSDAQSVEPRLSISVHDSDIATVGYAPRGIGSGTAYLGITPRTYFDNPHASRPTDVSLEARGLASWFVGIVGGPSEGEVADLIAPFLASDTDPDADADDKFDDDGVFVEDKVVRLLRALGMSVPEGLLDTE